MGTLEKVKEYRSKINELHRQHQDGQISLDDVTAKMENLDAAYGMGAEIEGDFHSESFFSDIGDKFKQIPHDLDPNRIRDLIRSEFQEVLHSSASQIARQAFRQSASLANKTYQQLKAFREEHADLVEAVDTLAISVSLSVITLHYDGFYGRAEGLTRLLSTQAEHFDFNRHSVRWIIENTGPKSIDININGELFTSAFSAGVGIHGERSFLVELVDTALEHVGVPE